MTMCRLNPLGSTMSVCSGHQLHMYVLYDIASPMATSIVMRQRTEDAVSGLFAPLVVGRVSKC